MDNEQRQRVSHRHSHSNVTHQTHTDSLEEHKRRAIKGRRKKEATVDPPSEHGSHSQDARTDERMLLPRLDMRSHLHLTFKRKTGRD